MDVKIGVTDTGRELVVSSTSNPDEIEAQIAESLKNPLGTLVLVDEKGRRVIVPSVTYRLRRDRTGGRPPGRLQLHVLSGQSCWDRTRSGPGRDGRHTLCGRPAGLLAREA